MTMATFPVSTLIKVLPRHPGSGDLYPTLFTPGFWMCECLILGIGLLAANGPAANDGASSVELGTSRAGSGNSLWRKSRCTALFVSVMASAPRTGGRKKIEPYGLGQRYAWGGKAAEGFFSQAFLENFYFGIALWDWARLPSEYTVVWKT